MFMFKQWQCDALAEITSHKTMLKHRVPV